MEADNNFHDIILQLQRFIEEHEGSPEEWYAGLALHPEEKLFGEHKVYRQFNSWIYRIADSSETAHLVHEALLQMGCDGQSHADVSQGAVYVYLKSGNTTP